ALTPRTVVQWSARSAVGQPAKGVQGQSMVRADGTMSLGPFGHVQVGGLTAEHARAAVVKQLAGQVKEPRLTFVVQGQAAVIAGAGGRAAGPGGGPPPPRAGPARPAAAGAGPAPMRAALHPPRPGADPPADQPPKPPETAPVPHPVPGHPPLTTPGPHPPAPHGAPTELGKRPLPPYVIEPPDILLIETLQTLTGQQPISGQHLLPPDRPARTGAS